MLGRGILEQSDLNEPMRCLSVKWEIYFMKEGFILVGRMIEGFILCWKVLILFGSMVAFLESWLLSSSVEFKSF